jgi:hypothetical protein
MNFIKSFFEDRGFDFKHNLKSNKISIDKREKLNEKLKNNVFFYSSSIQTKTSFYLITIELDAEELNDFRTFVWNENKVEMFFLLDKPKETELFKNIGFTLYYAKSSPKKPLKKIKIDSFSYNEKDIENLEKITKWQFESGTFWLNYNKFLDKIKKSKSIDKELIFTLKALKNELYNLIEDEKNVQALIDRTLYIKYLEDNHIINSAFYLHYFQNDSLDYKQLLQNRDVKNINRLFGIINTIFNNYLFQTPEIDITYLEKASELIYISLSRNINDNQLRLFDYQFNVLPVEFISYIYEVFLEEKSKTNGIYYTPKKLAQLIVDDVIPVGKIGTVLDPACGSGMFLIVAFQRLIENSNFESTSIEEIIEFRIKLLSENIFGIEKQSIAQRFTVFSLSLQIFKGLSPEKIKIYIADKLNREEDILLFRKNSFFENIICANSLNIEAKSFEGKVFNYIVGNPPFFEITELEGFENENKFLKDFETKFLDKTFKAKDIIGDKQISQCFLLKIKDWSDMSTRFGFVVNNPNFYGNAKNFQEFFFANYQLEKLYELSKVKKILFENAKASVNALIFNNNAVNDNFVKYYPIEMGLFSEKPFELLIINEDKAFEINQNDILNDKIRLRDYLIGNAYDLNFILKFENHIKMGELIESQKESYQGLTRKSNKEILDYFKITVDVFKKFSRKQKTEIQTNYDLENYSNLIYNDLFNIPFLYNYYHINNFKIEKVDGYINLTSINKENFQRHRDVTIFKGEKIIFTRVGNSIKAVLVDDCVFSLNIFGVKIKESKYKNLILALLNSDFVNYIVNVKDKIRIDDNFPRIDIKSIKNIPIPKDLDEDLVAEISKISNDLSTSKYNYEGENKEKLNNLIFDLYNLSYLEKQRIKDYFIKKATIIDSELENYKEALKDTIQIYFNDTITFDSYKSDFNLIVVKINIRSNINNPSTKKTAQFILNEIFRQNASENFLASQEKIFGKDCIYIIKKNENVNWTETKAYEDGQEILKRLN